jgi:hypothetical protein
MVYENLTHLHANEALACCYAIVHIAPHTNAKFPGQQQGGKHRYYGMTCAVPVNITLRKSHTKMFFLASVRKRFFIFFKNINEYIDPEFPG